MRCRLSLLIAFVGVLGLLGLVSTADATHDIKTGDKNGGTEHSGGEHEDVPTAPDPIVGGTCVVSGEVDVGNADGNGGVSATEKNHNHYFFRQTTIFCMNVAGSGNNVSVFEGSYDVDATGGTDGPGIKPNHGADDVEGWSHKACYEGEGDCLTDLHGNKASFNDIYDGVNVNGPNGCANCGEIIAAQIGGSVTAGTGSVDDGDLDGPDSESWVKFHRVGSVVETWGALVATAPATIKGDVLCFNAVLDFIPNNTDTNSGKTTGALLEGEATIWTANARSDCAGTKGTKK